MDSTSERARHERRGTRRSIALALLTAGIVSCDGEAPGEPRQPSELGTHAEQAEAILELTERKRGIAVVLGDPTGELALELARDSKLQVYSQLARAEDVDAVREVAMAAGLYGTRVYVEQGTLDRVHLADNLADLLVAKGDAAGIAEAEALRVVRPLGVVLRGESRQIKPPLDGADDWSHPHHGPDNNPQSDDQLARAPYLTQFLADPRYAPLPQVAVAANGRVFKAFGNVAFKRREEPWLNRLIAINGYNGSMLWIRNLAPGFMIHRNTLIATDDTLYLGDDQSCKVIDAATGRLLREIAPPAGIAGDTCFKWMALEGGVLYALIGAAEPPDPVHRHGREAHGWAWNEISAGHNANEYAWGYGRSLLAIDLSTEAVLWSHTEAQPIDSRAVCMKAGRIHLFSPGAYLVSLDTSTGAEVWRETAPTTRPASDEPRSTLRLTLRSIDRSSGTIRFSGVDTRRPTTPFTWSWGDGTSSSGFFPQEHRYGDVDQDYDVTVTAHYPDGQTDTKAATVCFRESQHYAPESAPALFDAIGPLLDRQGWATNWRTACYLKCSDDTLYFSGPQVGKLLAVSTADGAVRWEHPYDNFQLVLREEGLYGISGPFDVELSRLFDPLTGAVRAELPYGRRGCTRPTGTPDALLFRARGGSARLDVDTNAREWISPMRAQCQDGVTIANGHLYWWPSVCDCNLSLYGVTCLGPAGEFDFGAPVVAAERLATSVTREGADRAETLELTPADWPTFRANNAGTATSRATVARDAVPTWTNSPPVTTRPTAPVAAGGLVFLGGADGIVRALSAESGELRWRAFTGGGIRIPPTIAASRALVGSGDGHVYCFDARTGRQLWRFRAAPQERKIPVYGQLLSTWPVASGILVDDGIAYFAAGLSNYDSTHVYALDVETGELIWHNGTSGHLDADARTGVSVQGHLLLRDGELFLAGGTAVSPARYDAATGECRNDPGQLERCEAKGSRGWELYQIGTTVVACGRPYYADPRFRVFDADVSSKLFVGPTGERDVVLVDDRRLMCFPRIDAERLNAFVANRDAQGWFSYKWGEFTIPDNEAHWSRDTAGTMSIAVARNAAVLASQNDVAAVDLDDGSDAWRHPLPAKPVRWGLAIDRDGRSIVALEDGRVLAFGAERQ